MGLKKTEPKLGFDAKKTVRLKGPKIQGPWEPYYENPKYDHKEKGESQRS